VKELACSSVGLVQLMIARANQVDMLLLCDLIGELSARFRRVVDGVALDSISSIDDEEVRAICVGLVTHVFGKGDIVAPIS
jgi:hypothetical protein